MDAQLMLLQCEHLSEYDVGGSNTTERYGTKEWKAKVQT